MTHQNFSLRWPLQFIVTMILSTFIENNLIKTAVLLVFWGITFFPWKKIDFVFFAIVSIIFTISNYGALANSTFTFTHPDILLMPLNEFFMWGFYCLNAQRFITVSQDLALNKKKLLIYAGLFSIIFSLIHNEVYLAIVASILLGVAIFNFRSQRSFYYIVYFLLMGFVVETLGLHFELWFYPHVSYFEFPLWAPLMWGNIGLIISQMSLWIYEK